MSQENESILAFLLQKYLFVFLISVTVVHFFKCARASKFNATSSSPDNKKGSERCMISFFQLHTTISCLVVHLKLLNKAFIRFFQWSLPLGKGDPSALQGSATPPALAPLCMFLRCIMASCGDIGGKGTPRLGGRPGLELRSENKLFLINYN